MFAISGAAAGAALTKYSSPEKTTPVGSIIRDHLEGEQRDMLFTQASPVLSSYAVHTLVEFQSKIGVDKAFKSELKDVVINYFKGYLKLKVLA